MSNHTFSTHKLSLVRESGRQPIRVKNSQVVLIPVKPIRVDFSQKPSLAKNPPKTPTTKGIRICTLVDTVDIYY